MAHLEAAMAEECPWEHADARITAAHYLIQSLVCKSKPENFRDVIEYARMLDVVDFYQKAADFIDRGRHAHH